MRKLIASGLLSVLTFFAAVTANAQAPAPQTAAPQPQAPAAAAAPAPASKPEPLSPAEQACDAAMHDSTNRYVACLQRTKMKFDADLTAVMQQIPTSAAAKNGALASEVAASAKRLWRTNFTALGPAFRAYRDRDCEDHGIAEAGYGMGGMEARLECQINETSQQIDKLKERYGLK